MIDKKLGPYRITEEIGSGGMATVYRAYQPSTDRHVAIKVIRTNFLSEPNLRERFRREARLIARLEHPHLLPVYDFDGDHEPPYIVMRYLEGGTLKQVLAHGELPHSDVIYTLKQIAAALDYAHRQGVVHRDLKPSNIMIDREGNAFVMDFGIARAAGSDHHQLTEAGDVIGTPAYMSPEQARGEPDVGPEADLYALGVMVFEMLTGSVPYQHESSLGVLMAQLNDPVPSLHERNERVPEAADAVIRKALSKKKGDRHASAETFVKELAAALKAKQSQSPTRLQALTQTLSLEQLRAFEAKSKEGKKETPSQATPSEQQRQMTALYVDATELASQLYELGNDAETARKRMEKLWTRFDEIVKEEGGVIQSRTEDVGLALWGRARIREDDPERAIRAALRMRDQTLQEARAVFGVKWEPNEESPLPFLAGITTGPVLLERSSESGVYTASGSTITLAGRIKDAAPPGTVLVAHETISQVLGVFTVREQEPLRIRGRREAIEVFVVVALKPRAFRLKARGIEGIETKMIGREIELRLIQEALTLTVEDGETQVVTVVGEAGVGKSRLLFEFSAWTELMDQTVWLFEARATQPSMMQPYSLTRDLFSFRFQILDSDSLDVVHEKFVKGVAGFMGPESQEKAELIGQLVGFDFSHLSSVSEAIKDTEEFRTRALEYLGAMFAAASKINPVVIYLEDVHWADDRSLDLINNLVRENVKLPMFVLCMARPTLYERRPQWGEGQRFHERIQLEPLSQLSSRRLVRELLKKVEEVPTSLRDLVVERADGNPFYIEELIKAMIDDRVIVKGEDHWSVDSTRLSAMRIPATLTGVLQSRLDSLPIPLQQLLQRASVVGRVFWDDAAIHLSREASVIPDDVQTILEDLRQREMVLRREESGFAGTVEFVFRHAILRDATYETIVPRQRRLFHRQVADWLLAIGGERAGELTLLVAEHYERAGEAELAVDQLLKAGERATVVGAYDEGTSLLTRARDLVEGAEHVGAWLGVNVALAEVYGRIGMYDELREVLDRALPRAREHGDKLVQAKILAHLGRLAMWQDEFDAAKAHLDEALPLARAAGDEHTLLFVLRQFGNVMVDYPEIAIPPLEESLEIAHRLGLTDSEAASCNSLGGTYLTAGDFERAKENYERSHELASKTDNHFLVGMALSNLVAVHLALKDVAKAREVATLAGEKIRAKKELGLEGSHLEQEAWLEVCSGNDAGARPLIARALALALTQHVTPISLLALSALVEARAGRKETALEWLGAARAQPSVNRGSVELYWKLHDRDFTEGLSPEQIEAAVARGATMRIEELIEAVTRAMGLEPAPVGVVGGSSADLPAEATRGDGQSA
ncbi:MAG: protein kinase domain-containing protein [Candidatus Eiseniibacteriota bacterium]